MTRADIMPSHPRFTRRAALQAGSVGILGLGMNHLQAFREVAAAPGERKRSAPSVIYILLSGCLAQQDIYDMTPDARKNMRGDFR